MAYGVSLQTPIANAAYFRGRTVAGSIVNLIGVDPAGRVAIDPNAVGAEFFGNVLLSDLGAYVNWGPTVGSGGYGIRANAGTIEIKNLAGAWAPIPAAAAAAGGWTDSGTVVALSTGSDQVGIGTATPTAGTKLHVSDSDGATRVLLNGTTRGVRFGFDTFGSIIEGVDNTGTASQQPLLLSGSQIILAGNGIEGLRSVAGNLVVNESGGDIDFRVESDLNANAFVVDAGAFGGLGAVGVGAAPTLGALQVSPAGITAAVATSYGHLYVTPSGAVTIPAGTTNVCASLILAEPNITNLGTINNAYTLHIIGAPTEGTANGAINVAAGQVRFQGMPTSAAGLPAGTLWNNSGVVNIA